MKKLSLILLINLSTSILFGQLLVEKVWLTIYKGDSLTQDKFLVQISFDKNNTNYRILFDKNADTTETVITHFDKYGNDSVQIWKYPTDTVTWAYHWQYNDKNQLIRDYTSVGKTNDDTCIYLYNNSDKLIKKTYLYETLPPFDTLIYQNEKLKEIISFSPDKISHVEKYKYCKDGRIKTIVSYNDIGQKMRIVNYKYDWKKRKKKVEQKSYKTLYSTKNIEEIRKFRYSKSGIIQELQIIYFNKNYSKTYYFNENKEKIKMIKHDFISNEILIHEYERNTLDIQLNSI